LTSPKAFILLAKLIKNKIHLKGEKKHATGFRNIKMTGYKGILFLMILPTKQASKSVFLSSSSASHFPATPRIGNSPL
jgi:hypothetical protein